MISFWETKALSPDVDMADASKPFIQSNLTHNIDSVYLYHLNRSIDEPKELYPLYKVLTTINPFYEYLLSKEIEFEYLNQIIYLKYKGQRIPKSRIYVPGDPHKGDNLLARRFGYFDTPDFCINGFIHPINPQESTDGYYYHLYAGPELLECLERFLKIPGLQMEYKQKSKYYYSAVLLPIEDIVFDNNESIDSSEKKTYEFLYSCISFLSDWHNDYPVLSNRIIRVNDHKSLTVHHNILLE